MKKIIHQIFLDVGLGKLEDNELYMKNLEINKKKWGHKYEFKIWNDDMVEKLVKEFDPKIQNYWNNFPNKFYKVDFSRFLILYKEGGIYLDMDLLIKKDPEPIYNVNFLALWNIQNQDTGEVIGIGDRKVNNDVIHLNNKNDYLEFTEFSMMRSKKCKIPFNRKQRRFKYSCGNSCFNMFCKMKKYSQKNYQGLVNEYFFSYWTSTMSLINW